MDPKVTFAIFFFTAIIGMSYGLKCYTCDGTDDCEDEFVTADHATLLKNCNSTSTYCLKTKSGVNNVWTNVVRSCAEDCEETNILYVHRTDCCMSDGCNGASTVFVSVGLLAASLTAIYGVYKK